MNDPFESLSSRYKSKPPRGAEDHEHTPRPIRQTAVTCSPRSIAGPCHGLKIDQQSGEGAL
jgi:hypothetical protein